MVRISSIRIATWLAVEGDYCLRGWWLRQRTNHPRETSKDYSLSGTGTLKPFKVIDTMQ
jgi:hypothetical protein